MKSYTGFPTSHQPRFYAAPNFLKMGIKYLKKMEVMWFGSRQQLDVEQVTVVSHPVTVPFGEGSWVPI